MNYDRHSIIIYHLKLLGGIENSFSFHKNSLEEKFFLILPLILKTIIFFLLSCVFQKKAST